MLIGFPWLLLGNCCEHGTEFSDPHTASKLVSSRPTISLSKTVPFTELVSFLLRVRCGKTTRIMMATVSHVTA